MPAYYRASFEQFALASQSEVEATLAGQNAKAAFPLTAGSTVRLGGAATPTAKRGHSATPRRTGREGMDNPPGISDSTHR